jgi:hypothetical protein
MAWLYQSRKAQVALGAILTIVLSRLLPRLGFTTEDVNAIGMAIGAIASVWIGGIAHEDASSKQAPQNQTNVNSDVTNAPARRAGRKARSPSLPTSSISSTARSGNVHSAPSRYRLPHRQRQR